MTWRRIRQTQYEVCRSGKVRNRKTKKILAFRPQHDGYLKVHLVVDGVDYYPRIHRLVAEAFIPNPERKEEVDHINGKRTDNRSANLRWVTRSENQRAIKERKVRKKWQSKSTQKLSQMK